VLILVESFGPSVVLLMAVLLASSLVRKLGLFRAAGFSAGAGDRTIGGGSTRSGELDAALDDAVAFNSFDIQSRVDPSVRLQAVIRFAPTDYGSVAREIAQHFRERAVISIDLAGMEQGQAVRLVDFCSGLALMCSGWIFRVTDRVIVLTHQSSR
jgi:hypothetical protein